MKSFEFITFRNLGSVKVFILLAITTWIVHFWYSASFGLYEDDYGVIAAPMGMSWSEFLGMGWSGLWNVMLNGFTADGRPIFWGLDFLFAFLGTKLGGLQGIYWIAYILLTINSFLFYLLLKRLYDQQAFTITGALAFCLFPANTSYTWLTLSLTMQSSLMFLLIAFLCYISGSKKVSYLFAFGILLCYETFFPVFLAAPLLKRQWDLKVKRELFRHILVPAALLICILIVRRIAGEGRVNDLHIFSALRVSLRAMLYGPIVSMGMFLYRPIETLLLWDFRNSNTQYIPWSVAKNIFLGFLPLCFAGLMWVLYSLKLKASGDALLFTISLKTRVFLLEIPQFFKDLAKLSSLGVIMLILAYPFALTTDPTTISGRDSRVHLPAVIGASILCACVCSAILFIANAYGKKHLANMGLAAFFSLLVGFGLIVQNDYKTSWQYQRAFWTDVIRLCPDLTDGTRIFVEDIGMRQTKYITSITWPTISTLPYIYRFPDNWKIPPRLFLLLPNWVNNIVSDRNLFELNGLNVRVAPSVGDSKFESSNVILLEIKKGKLTRKTYPLIIDGRVFPLKKESDSEIPLLKKGALYNYLIMPSDERNPALPYLW